VANALGEEGMRWITGLLERFAETERRATEAEQRASRLEAELAAAHARIAELEEDNRRLRARLAKDSSNSSKPPSSDGPGAKARKRRRGKRKPSGRKAGGQPGHEGTTRELEPVENADEVHDHFPTSCGCCGHGLAGANEVGDPVPHQQYELPPLRLLLIHHWRHRLQCPQCGAENLAGLDPMRRTGQGPRLTAFIGLLTCHNRQSRSLVRDLIDDLFGLRISTGTVQACFERLGAALAQPVSELEDALGRVGAVHLDETGWRQWGKRCWLWVATTGLFSLFMIHPRRGTDALRLWFPEGFDGTVHSDRWSAYSYFDIAKRQLCWAHLIRDLQAIIDAGGSAAELAKKIREGEKAMFRHWALFRAGDINREQLQARTGAFREAFRDFCQAGAAQEDDDLWRKLGSDLIKKWPAVFRFLDVEGLEPTNNAAERAVRPGVIWRKLAQGTRSDTGSTCVSRALSTVATCRKRGIDVLDYLTEAMSSYWRGIPPPRLLPGSNRA
jgi:transposase